MTPRLDLLKLLSARLRSTTESDTPSFFNEFNVLFDMATWKQKNCKTTCCAAGLGVETIPEWQDVFMFIDHKNGWGSMMTLIVRKTTFCKEDFSTQRFADPPYSVYIELAAGLGIEEKEAVYVFDPTTYSGLSCAIEPAWVADRIDQIVSKYKSVAQAGSVQSL